MAKDRYAKTNQQRTTQRRRAESDKAAEASAAAGKFVCIGCGDWYGIEEFTYTFQGEKKVARRCWDCRESNRSKRRRNNV